MMAAGPGTLSPSWNAFHDVQQILQYPFMRHALVAGTIVAVVAGVAGYFVVIRRSAFAAHAMSEIGFAGASGGLAFGFSAVLGLLGMAFVGAILIGLLGARLRDRDTAVGTVLAFSLGLGAYFLTRYKGNASGGYSLLFGEILASSVHDVWLVAITASVSLAALAVVFRPLLFASLDPDVAEAQGVPVRGLSIVFLLILAGAVTAAVQVVGVLLIFSLMVTPAAIAERLCRTPARAIALAVALAVTYVWASLAIAYYSKFPVGFLVTFFAFVTYLGVRLALWANGRSRAQLRSPHA